MGPIGIGDRPQGYVLLSRGLGRGSYLLGLFEANDPAETPADSLTARHSKR